jgi:cephalosporin hydroxylase
MNEYDRFKDERTNRVNAQSSDPLLLATSHSFLEQSFKHKYSYNFEWLGRPIIQYPQDIVIVQELIWQLKPDLIIETGVAHGGSLMLSASLLALIDICEALEEDSLYNPRELSRKVIGIDIDIRQHNKEFILSHPLSRYLMLIEGSSIDNKIIEKVSEIAGRHKRVMLLLDSNHTHNHVLAELNAYANLVSDESYCIVFDTMIENLPRDLFHDRPWTPENNPKSAIKQFLETNSDFSEDKFIDKKLLVSVAPGGFLKRKIR